uniref:U1 small nuclear ribonucleoprotein C n=1 Tax=Oryzias latipes TaxID=8090 RepID=H2LSV0_ORYLA
MFFHVTLIFTWFFFSLDRFYCDYCDTYLTHDSPSVRKTHCSGRKHKENVKDYYQKWMEEQAQSLIDKTSKTFGLSCAIRTISFHLLFILSYLFKKNNNIFGFIGHFVMELNVFDHILMLRGMRPPMGAPMPMMPGPPHMMRPPRPMMMPVRPGMA